jgi:hypothetical protein
MFHCFRTFIKLLEGLLQLCNTKVSIAECFFKLSDVNWDKGLQEQVNKVVSTLFELSIIHFELW